MPKKIDDEQEIIKNSNLTTLYVDDVYINYRKDGMYFIRYTAFLPEGEVEQVRLMTNKRKLRSLLDAMCLEAEYYPKKPSDEQKDINEDSPSKNKSKDKTAAPVP